MGKRVDFMLEVLLLPDPNIELDELGVPVSIAKNITYPEIVNQYNIKSIQKLLDNKFTYPSIKILVKKNGTNITLTESNINDIELENGDTVHRSCMDGDYVLFNRQPFLHK